MGVINAIAATLSAERFAQWFNQLVAATAQNGADAALIYAKQEVYYRALQSRPAWAVEHAARQLMETVKFFPAASEWVQAADGLVQQKLRESLAGAREWNIYCAECRDGGWRSHDCQKGQRCGLKFCERADVMGITYSHEYVSLCPCREHNPAFLREQERTRAQANARAVKESRRRGN